MSFLRERMTDALTTETMRRRHLRRVMEIEEGLYHAHGLTAHL